MIWTNDLAWNEGQITFDSAEEARSDLENRLTIEDYICGLPCVEELVTKFFARKTNDEFCNWLEEQVLNQENTLITAMVHPVDYTDD